MSGTEHCFGNMLVRTEGVMARLTARADDTSGQETRCTDKLKA
ncbi:hypothetical protein ACICHK_43445 (plasmid) [Streptomyces sp. AHU1]